MTTRILDSPERVATAPRFQVVDGFDEEVWTRTADRCPYATFFHTPAWLKAFAGAFPHRRLVARRFEFEDGTTALFPLIEETRAFGLYRHFASTAAWCYGGPISVDPLSPAHLLAIGGAILRACPNLFWRFNPLLPHVEILAPLATDQDSTEILDLQGFEDEDALRRHYRHNVRKQINKACRAGLRACEASAPEEWDGYLRLYRKRLSEWGEDATSSFPPALFRSFQGLAGERVKLWVVYLDGRLIGGNLNFYHGTHCVEWHAAYDREFFACGVRDFLVDWIIRDARRRGFRHYDFNPSGVHEGSRRFKQTFGTVSHPSHFVVQRAGISRLRVLRQVYRSMTRVWRY